MKKLCAAFAAGLILSSAVPVMAADNAASRQPYCWQAADNQSSDGWYCRGRGCGRQGRGGGYCWDDSQASRQ